MIRTLALVAALLAAVSVGCKSKRKAERRDPVVETPPRDAADALFVIATPRVERAEVPARFAAPLPSAIDTNDPYPPDPYVDAALASDAAGMRARLLAAAERAARDGTLSEDLRNYLVHRLQAAGQPACDWIAGVAVGAAPAPVRAVFWDALARCTGPATAAALARDDAPDAAVIDWYFQGSNARVPFQPRVARAAVAIARTGADHDVRKLGFAFAAMDGPEVVPAMVALQRSISDPKRRALAALGLLNHPAKEARALGRAACAQAQVADDAMCGGDPDHGDAPVADLAAAIVGWDYDPEAIMARFERKDVIAALTACAAGTGDDAEPGRCLPRLAGLDRAAAVAAARTVPPDPDDASLAAVVAALRAFPEAGALERELATLGFTPVPGATMPDQAPISVEDVLTAYGRVHRFDTETGQWPNEHDGLLAELAALAAPALDGVVFEEDAGPDSDAETPYLLRAYAGGNRYQVEAENLGDWYDVEAVLGLLNAVAIARKSDVRFVTLPTGDQTSSVVAGRRAGLVSLVQRRLLVVAAPGDAEDTGKEFEDRVLEQLQREGQAPL